MFERLNLCGLWHFLRKRMDDGGISVESAIVKFTDKTKGELIGMVLEGEIVACHTNPEGHLLLGAVGMV